MAGICIRDKSNIDLQAKTTNGSTINWYKSTGSISTQNSNEDMMKIN